MLAHDRAAALLREDQHLEHAIARRVGEILLHELERRARCRARVRAAGNRANATRSARRAGRGEVGHGLRERAPGRDRRHEIAQPVGPRRLHLAHARAAAGGRSTPRGNSATATAGTSATKTEPVSAGDDEQREAARRRRCPPRSEPAPSPTPACCSQRSARPRRPRCDRSGRTRIAALRHRAHEQRRGDERAAHTDRSAASTLMRSSPTALEEIAKTASRAAARDRRAASSPGGSAPVHSSGRPSAVRTKIGSKVCSSPRLGTTAVISVTCRRTAPVATRRRRRGRRARRRRAPARTHGARSRSVTFSPAISAAFTSAFSASGALLA